LAAPPVESVAVVRIAFNRDWSVVISTQSGSCDPQYRFGVQIINGIVVYRGKAASRRRFIIHAGIRIFQ
jgi:hypothetical protein